MKIGEMWRRPDTRFLIFFLTILGVSFTVIALRPVNDAVVVPYTAFIARVSGTTLRLFGEQATVSGCVVSSPRFAVTIFNGCNGLITSLIFVSGVLAFPARWPAKVIGVVGGLLAIQLINLVRIVSLFFIGIFFPTLFNDAHTSIWQSVVILAGVGLWIAWAHFLARPEQRPS
ncbi:MAG: exosortase H [Acidobacteriota bacterium]|nr:exosortase H [Acidobacteriota bacterium]